MTDLRTTDWPPNDRLTDRPTLDRPDDRPKDHKNHRPNKPPKDRPIEWLNDRPPNDRRKDRLNELLNERPKERPTERTNEQTTTKGPLNDWPIDPVIDQSTNLPNDRMTKRITDRPFIVRLNSSLNLPQNGLKNQRSLLVSAQLLHK